MLAEKSRGARRAGVRPCSAPWRRPPTDARRSSSTSSPISRSTIRRHRSPSIPAEHPLVAAARLVPEDLVVMTRHEGRLRVQPPGWSVSRTGGIWRPRSAGPMHDVHAPVARLNEQLAAPIDAFFERLTPEKSFWRLGWGIIETPELYQPLDGTAARSRTRPRAATTRANGSGCGWNARRCGGSRVPVRCCSRSAPTSPGWPICSTGPTTSSGWRWRSRPAARRRRVQGHRPTDGAVARVAPASGRAGGFGDARVGDALNLICFVATFLSGEV